MIKVIKIRHLFRQEILCLESRNKFCFNSLHKKPFQILGVNKNATQKQIKTAYYKLAKQFHPDINKQKQNAHAVFSQINKAYSNMINSMSENHKKSENQKQWQRRQAQQYEQEFEFKNTNKNRRKREYESKRQYNDHQDEFEDDQTISQEDFNKFQKAFQSFIRKGKIDPKYKVYEKFFVNYFSKGSAKKNKQDQQDNWDEQLYGFDVTSRDTKFTTVQTKLDITQQQAEQGLTKRIVYKKTAICQTCSGNVKSRRQQCRRCGGTGWIGKRAQIIMTCSNCHGNGQIKIHGCKTCRGRGSLQKQVEQCVTIPKGTLNNNTITLKGRGNQHPKKFFFGDLIIKIKINNKPHVTKNGFDTHSTLNLSISQAVLGSYVKYYTLHGDQMMNLQKGYNDGDTIRLKGEGMRKGTKNGDHFLKVKIQIPKKISKQQQKIYQQLRKLQKQKKFTEQQQKQQPEPVRQSKYSNKHSKTSKYSKSSKHQKQQDFDDSQQKQFNHEENDEDQQFQKDQYYQVKQNAKTAQNINKKLKKAHKNSKTNK